MIPVKGCADVRVMYEGKDRILPLIIAQNAKGVVAPNLLGCDWLSKVHLNWSQIVSVNSVRTEVL